MVNATVETFGAIDPAAQYVLRPGGYLVIVDSEGRIATVHTSSGVYLPGGGQELGETPQQAAVREAREECGLGVAVERWLGVADELVHDVAEGLHYRKRCEFFLARVRGESSGREPGHRLVWLSRHEAASCLSHGSQQWALSCAATLTGVYYAERDEQPFQLTGQPHRIFFA